MPKISLLVPAYNESAIFMQELPDFLAWVKSTVKDAEVIIVENGSTDDTLKQANDLAKKYSFVRVFHQDQASFGAAVKESIKQARGDISVLLNADWLDQDFITTIIKRAKDPDWDIIVGSKVLDKHLDHRPILRKMASHLLTFVLKMLFKFNLSDSHGLKAFKTKQIQPLAESCMMNEIVESELLLLATLHHLSITEVPVAIEEHRAPRIGFLKRIIRVGSELVKLYRVKSKHLYEATR